MGNGKGIVEVFLKYGAEVIIIDYADSITATIQEFNNSKVTGYKADIRDMNMSLGIVQDIVNKRKNRYFG